MNSEKVFLFIFLASAFYLLTRRLVIYEVFGQSRHEKRNYNNTIKKEREPELNSVTHGTSNSLMKFLGLHENIVLMQREKMIKDGQLPVAIFIYNVVYNKLS